MSWGLGWKRPSEIFHLSLNYGTEDFGDDLNRSSSASSFSSSSSSSIGPYTPQDQELGFRIELDWTAGDDEDQIALRLQSQLMVALPLPQDAVEVELRADEEENVGVQMRVLKRREPLRGLIMAKATGSGQQSDGVGVLTRFLRSNIVGESGNVVAGPGCGEHWRSITMISLYACGLSALPVDLTKLPLLEKLYLDNNKLSVLPPELGELKNLKVLSVDNNILVSVPVELRQCIELEELSLGHKKLLNGRAMAELQILRLFGNPLEFLPKILLLQKLRHLSLANIRIVADENLRSVNVQIETENNSYFGASRHKLSAFFSLIFRFSSCHHPLLAFALMKIMQDQENRVVVGKDENAIRQLISMISSDDHQVVEQAYFALSSLAGEISVALQLMKCDIMQPIETALKSDTPEVVISVLQVVGTLGFASDTVAQKMLTKDLLRSLKLLCSHKTPEVQRLALFAVGNLAFCLENRRVLVTSESLRELLLRLMIAHEPCVNKAAARALAILGENESLRRAIRDRPVAKQGLRILSMDGGGMKGLATVQILKAIEKRTGKQIHELFDLICCTSTGGMLAVALGIKLMSLDQCEEIYKNLGKIVFAEPVPKDNEAATWREKLDQLYKSSSQSFRVVVHGSKHSADQFQRLLKEICADEDGDLLIESAVKNIPKVFVVSTLVSVTPAQPFIFRNYQYPAGSPEVPFAISESSGVNMVNVLGSPTTGAQVGYQRSAFIGSYVNRWQDGAIVANNPTIFAMREAQLLWPDTKIDCLFSIGRGSVPRKVQKGGWRYLDTGQVLIESACSVDKVEESLSTLLAMLPDIHYFRFNPVDEHCDMELDEADPAIWLKFEAAVDEYIQKNSPALKSICERLILPYQLDEKWLDNIKAQHFPKAKTSNADENSPSLGWRRNVILVEAFHSPDSGRPVYHAQTFESFRNSNGIRLSTMQGISQNVKTVSSTAFSTPFASPLVTGSFPSSPLIYSPDFGPQRFGRIDMVPPLSLDGKMAASPPMSPSGPRKLSLHVQLLHEKLQNSPQVGIIHLALQNDSCGSILSWQNDVFVVAEPGELAEKFLQSVKHSLLSIMWSHHRKGASLFSSITTVSDLVRCRPYFQVGNIVHRYMGRQTQVLEDQEISAYMFRRTVPFMHLTPDDVRWMVGAWRDRIIICTGTYGPAPSLVKAFLNSGAKTVICPSAEPRETELTVLQGTGELDGLENGRFEIGEEEAENGENIEEEHGNPEVEVFLPSSHFPSIQ
ncbi:phospholipase A I [Tripterygium wilfordii]|uniref:Patatin n=1 Tax=Tripterygium wilfordii TaxID=458696 RepID=A0A7J7C365_TRIWF|nr:phospholipase A I [Tripterygium wilfordii]